MCCFSSSSIRRASPKAALPVITVAGRIRAGRRAGRTDTENRESRPAADVDAAYGNGFIEPDVFVQMMLAAVPR